MRTTLQSLADIRTGYTFRGKIVPDSQGNVRVLQIKDIKGWPAVHARNLTLTKFEDAEAVQPLHVGDVVLPARGEYYQATLFGPGPPDSADEPVIATSQLWVIRVKDNSVSPPYLCWYLNQSATRQKFLSRLSGSNILMLNKEGLSTLPIAVPSLETQLKIVTLQYLWEQEKKVTQQLLVNREKMLSGIFGRLLES